MNVQAINHISGHSMAIYDVVFYNDRIYTTSADKFVVRWDLKSGEQDDFTVKLDHSAYRIALNDAGQILIGDAKGGLHFVAIKEKKEKRYLTQHQSPIFALSFNSSKKEFYSGDGDGYIAIWDANSMDLKLIIPLTCGKIRCIAVNESGEFIAVCGQDGYILVFETNFFNEIHTFRAHKDGVNCAIFLGENLFTGGKDAHIKKWNWKDEKQLLSIPAHNYAVYDFSIINDSGTLVSASFDKTIKLFNTSDLNIIKRLEAKDKGHKHTVNRLAKINESEFISVSDDRNIIHWRI